MDDLIPVSALLFDALLIVVMTSVIVWREAGSWRAAWRSGSTPGKHTVDMGGRKGTQQP